MQFEGAKVTEQCITFGIVIVKPYVLSSTQEQSGARAPGTEALGPIPIVLMAQDSRGAPTHQGRPDTVRFRSNVFVEQIPWRRYTLSAA